MNIKTKKYTLDKLHPEDAIFKVKTFINNLQEVQEERFQKLVNNLNLTKEGEDWLFDYVYNASDNEYDGFEHYLEDFKKKYDDLVARDIVFNDSSEVILSTDFEESSPMDYMTSCEASLATAFPSAYNDNEPFSLGLDSITFDTKNVEPDNQI